MGQHQLIVKEAIARSGASGNFHRLIVTQRRSFATPTPKKQATETPAESKKTTTNDATEKVDSKEEVKRKESEYEEDDDEYEQKAEFTPYRRFGYAFGKMFKYGCWLLGGIFIYHIAMVVKKDKPEEAFGVFEPMLYYAHQANGFYEFLHDLLTKPPVSSLLMERPPTPPGYQSMKTLVLNVTGTLTHSEYKVSNRFLITNQQLLTFTFLYSLVSASKS